jgi:hypothetical protein
MSKARKIQSEAAEQMPLTKAMQMTIASLRLEGVTLSAASIADLQSVESGKLSQKEAIARVLARVQK